MGKCTLLVHNCHTDDAHLLCRFKLDFCTLIASEHEASTPSFPDPNERGHWTTLYGESKKGKDDAIRTLSDDTKSPGRPGKHDQEDWNSQAAPHSSSAMLIPGSADDPTALNDNVARSTQMTFIGAIQGFQKPGTLF